MKRIILLSVILFFITGFSIAQIAVNTDGADPDPSAMLQVSSDSKGFLPPQMTILQRDQIQNPAAGLMIFNSDHRCVNFYDGNEWIGLGCNPNLPVAELYGSDPQGEAPKEIYFNDLSSGNPTSWLWDFGDGGSSTEQNPIYTYTTPGFYTVSLTVSNEYGTDTQVEVDYVTISGPGDCVPCPGAIKVVDADFNEYLTVQIGTQCWMRENLKVTKYPDGTAIPNVTDNGAWSALVDDNTDDAFCYHENNENSLFGALYTYAAAIGDNWEKDNAEGQGVCPDGWHLPTRDEWDELNSYLLNNGYNWDGSTTGSLKNAKSVASLPDWSYSSVIGTPGNDPQSNNATNLSLQPMGYRNFYNGLFLYFGEQSRFLSSTEHSSSDSKSALLTHQQESLHFAASHKSSGLAIRCVKNSAAPSNPPTAAFSNTTATGQAPFYVMFTDESTGSPTSWSWDFGDGNTSTVQNAEHTYNTAGTYTVSLTVTNADGSDTETKVDLVEVTDPPGPGTCPGIPTVTDIDGNIYNTVQIGTQCWMRENLQVTKYPNNTDIPLRESTTSWEALANDNEGDAYCYYDNDATSTFGVLYTFAAAIADNWVNDLVDGQGICPDGWHLPTDEEWKVLEGTVDTQYPVGDVEWNYEGYRGFDAGHHLKNDSGYNNSQNGDNSSGFTALPGGWRSGMNANFYQKDNNGYWWTADEPYVGSDVARSRFLSYESNEIQRARLKKSSGLSVRCILNDD